MSDGITRINLDTAIDSDRTDWKRLRQLNDATIEAAIAADPDTFATDGAANNGNHRGGRYVISRNKAGDWRWALLDADRQIIAVSAKPFASRSAAAFAIEAMRSMFLAGDVRAA